MYAIVDIETTGTNAGYHGITEVAIYMHDGEKVVDSWQSLINPQVEIPPFIQQMTGITNEMVATAPLFEDVAAEIYALLHNTIFVAHNAGFDYGFIKAQLANCGYALHTKKLCTVRLSRKIIPGMKSYSLGRLCDALGIVIHDRHRAAGDALATAALFTRLVKQDTGEHIQTALKRGTKEQLLPPHMDKHMLENLPTACGVYYFHDAGGKIIYVGKAKNIKSRIYGHFTYADSDGKENALRDAVHDITTTLTGNELVALLLESEEIKRKFPRFNNAQKKWDRNFCIFTFIDQLGYRHLAIERYSAKKEVLKVFPDYLSARTYLNDKLTNFQLCGKLTHLQTSRAACFNHDLGFCLGACVGKEQPDAYNSRIAEAIAAFKEDGDSYFIFGVGRSPDETAVVCVEKGHYLGFGYFHTESTPQDLESIKSCIKWRPDTPDVQRILTGWVSRNLQNKHYKIVKISDL